MLTLVKSKSMLGTMIFGMNQANEQTKWRKKKIRKKKKKLKISRTSLPVLVRMLQNPKQQLLVKNYWIADHWMILNHRHVIILMYHLRLNAKLEKIYYVSQDSPKQLMDKKYWIMSDSPFI